MTRKSPRVVENEQRPTALGRDRAKIEFDQAGASHDRPAQRETP
jgi:hypothetical protein